MGKSFRDQRRFETKRGSKRFSELESDERGYPRYGNNRKYMAEMKVKGRRIERANNAQAVQAEIQNFQLEAVQEMNELRHLFGF